MLIAQEVPAYRPKPVRLSIPAAMVIASLNGTHAQGFIEVIERSDGSIERTGLLKLSAPSANELRSLLDAHEPLTYVGPVRENGRWICDTFPIRATNVAMEPGLEPGCDETLHVTVRGESTNSAEAR